MKRALVWSVMYQVVLVAVLGIFLFKNNSSVSLSLLSQRFSMWDARHYLYLAEHGYSTSGDERNFIVFYPLYPLLIRANPLFYISPTLSAITITAITSIAGHAFFLLYLEKIGYSQHKKIRAFVLLCVSPTAVYFMLLYTEGLFLLLTCLFLYLLVQKKYLYASFAGATATMTRLPGLLFILPFAGTILLDTTLHFKQKVQKLSAVAIILSGFLLYTSINIALYNDPLAWQKIQANNWHKTATDPISRYKEEVQSFSFQKLATLPRQDLPTYLVDQTITLGTPLLLVLYLVVKRRKANLIWIVWILGNFFLVASQTYWLSNARYLGLVIPLYLILEDLTERVFPVYIALVLIFGSLALFGLDIFIKGLWLY